MSSIRSWKASASFGTPRLPQTARFGAFKALCATPICPFPNVPDTKSDPHVSVGVAAQRGYWNLEHPAFGGVRLFLQSL